MQNNQKKTLLIYSLSIVITIAIFIGYGFIYKNSKFQNYEIIDGNRIYYKFIGEKGPTVVFDTGLGGPGFTYNSLVQKVSNFSSVFYYDRLGLGSSDFIPLELRPRTTLDMVEDLHTLLEKAKIPGPFILVSHSISGFNARLFADKYLNEISGLILIDVSHPDQDIRMNPGISSEEINKHYNELKSNPPEYLDLETSADQVRRTGIFGNIPLIVITAGIDLNDEKLQLQKELCLLSTQSEHIIAEKSTHMVYVDQPQLVIDAIFNVLSK